MQCKKALEDAGGDPEKALEFLRKKGAEVADKKASRTLGAGVVHSYLHTNGTVGTLIELNVETDFVAKHDDFKALAYDIAMHITALNPQFLDESEISEEAKEKAKALFKEEVDKLDKPEEIKQKVMEGKLSAYFGDKTLMKQAFIKNPELTIADLIKNATQKFGEKIQIGKFARFSVLGK